MLLNKVMMLLSTMFQSILGEVTTENFWKSLELMGKGMLGNFVVIVIIYIVIVVLNKATGKKSDKE